MTGVDLKNLSEYGLYTVPVAARILATKPEKVRSWVEGYTNSGAEPILVRQVPRIGGRPVLGFLDLIESAFIRHFREIGYSPQTIRKVALKLRDKHSTDHPFAMNKRFRADGKSIFEEVITDEGERRLVNVMTDNFVMRTAIEQTLFDQVFYIDDTAVQWTPLVAYPDIIMNPRIAFGRPVLRQARIPTETIARSAAIEDSISDTADEFGIPINLVEAAINFEAELEKRTLH